MHAAKTVPPTVFTTRSTPLPVVAFIAGSWKPAPRVATPTSSPSSASLASFCSEPEVPMTFVPSALPTCSDATPTPDETPVIKGSALKALEGDADAQKAIIELAEALDTYIPEPERDLDKPFLMPIEDIFSITGRGTVATGRIEQGVVNTGDEVEIVGIHPEIEKTTITGVEMFRKILDEGQAGDNIGALLRGTKREDIERGQVLCKPGSITPHTKFKSEVYCLKKEEGGRHTPFFSGYRPQFYFRTTDVTGVANLPEGTEMVTPGDNVEMTIELIQPIAMDQGLRFAIREGGRTVGSGVVTEIIE